MKKLMFTIVLAMLLVAGCGANKMDFTVETAPTYEDGVASELVVEVTESDAAVTGLQMVATLEMAKMDHGIIEVVFEDNGDGTYAGDVELDMAGEWIADIKVDNDGKTTEEVLIFDVKER